MPLSKEQLLIPRYKCIALWMFEPKSSLGAIYEQPNVPRGGQWTAIWNWWDEMANHPHLFQLLPWWSDRKLEEMPEYVVDTNLVFHKAKWKEHPHGVFMYLDDEIDNGWHVIENIMCFYAPATPEEYTAYINQNK